jgi:uncharacterized SAM-binding protein YcdF (DUF218 family)
MESKITKTAVILVGAVLAFVVIPSIPKVRTLLARPLIVSDEAANGDACYVLGAGNAIWERLAAASDLYHMKRVPKIILMREDARGPYSFTAKASWSASEWAIEYLVWRGVPRDKILLIDHAEGSFGTFAEARNLARNGPPDVKKLVLATSPPHTRRSLLAFRRALPKDINIIPYSATSFETSAELYHPLWLEYLKLLLYKLFLFQ